MALLTFPVPAINGTIYPVSPPAGVNVYQYSSVDQTWRLLGPASGVTAGTYGTPLSVPQITIDATGRITVATDVPIQLGDTTQVGLVQLVDDTTSNDPTKALTAAQGFYLQNQIGDVALLSPPAPNLVTAINAVAAPTGVTTGTYGNSLNVGQFTVNAEGRITLAANVPIALATTAGPGIVRVGTNLNVTGTGLLSVPNASTTVTGAVQLVNNTTTNDSTKALTAAAGYNLQQQIDAINVKNNLTFAGTVSALTGLMTVVTAEGTAAGFVVGFPLPVASAFNDEYFVIVDAPGTFTPPGSPPVTCRPGDWLISDGSQWVLFAFMYGSVTQVNTGTGLTGGPITTSGTISLVPATTSSLGGVVPDGTSVLVTPSGVISTATSGTVTQINTGTGLSGGPITSSGTLTLNVATTSALGGVIADGTTIAVNGSGVISARQRYIYFDDISSQFNGTTSTFNLTVGGVAYAPTPSSNILIVVGGVPQPPGTAYTISGSTITFVGGAPPTGISFLATTIG